MTLSVRPATPHDAPALARLAARTFPLACPPELPADAVRDFIGSHLDEESFRGYLSDPTHTVLVGYADRTDHAGAAEPAAYALLVDGVAMDRGCAHLLHGRRPAGISKFYLDPARHGSGGATTLLDAVFDHSVRADADSLWLATNVGNARARAFYAKTGFEDRGARVFEVGGTLNDDVVLERML